MYTPYSFYSPVKLAMVEVLPSMKSFKCHCCLGMMTISNKDASYFVVASCFKILYLDEEEELETSSLWVPLTT